MFWDIVIVAGISDTQLVITWYGVHVSVEKKRMRNAIVIGLIGGIGVGLAVWLAVRSATVQLALQAQLDKIQRNTETPQPAPTVIVNNAISPIAKRAHMATMVRLLQPGSIVVPGFQTR
jgi:hypothetical protein